MYFKCGQSEGDENSLRDWKQRQEGARDTALQHQKCPERECPWTSLPERIFHRMTQWGKSSVKDRAVLQFKSEPQWPPVVSFSTALGKPPKTRQEKKQPQAQGEGSTQTPPYVILLHKYYIHKNQHYFGRLLHDVSPPHQTLKRYDTLP